MIRYTFQHISGFGALKEKELWERNILTWDDFDNQNNLQLTLNFTEFTSLFKESRERFEQKEGDFFAQKLPPQLYYRIAHSFPEKTIFLDIETTGLSRYYNHITIVGWSIMDKYKVHIVGDEKSKEDLLNDLKNSSCIVTFNGALFDVPFLKAKFPEVKIPKSHIDLRFFSRRVGLQGGQKIVEEIINVKRPKDFIEVDGFEATLLWHKYKEGDLDSLRKLIKYNALDIHGMKTIFEKVTKMLLSKEKLMIKKAQVFPFSSYKPVLNFSETPTSEKIYLPKYTGRVGPSIYLSDLPALPEHRIVGIDLTGSEAKASGWASLQNGLAYTKMIFSNAEIIEETIKIRPTVVSIDSPLSLPQGRISVFDDDPGRHEFGITRVCERVMAKRGVKSYPCLIQSMQRLTQRGILLANQFRKLGYSVIESYPGAAQDILGIPRKKKSMEYLIKGLKSFGISGDYDKDGVTHDEIDAITSALVGHFHLSDKYEGLGNDKEGYMIIPQIGSNLQLSNRIVIGISGFLSVGKTTVGKILEEFGFYYGRYSIVVDSCLRNENKEITRTSQQQMGDYINRNKGQRWLGKELIKLMPSGENLVIDGLRFLEDHSFLREQFGLHFFHIHLVADVEKRRERYYTKFLNDKSFESADSHTVEAEINGLEDFADVVISNNSTVEVLRTQIQLIFNKICRYQ